MSHLLIVHYGFIPETTHFLQLEDPEECAVVVREFMRLQCFYQQSYVPIWSREDQGLHATKRGCQGPGAVWMETGSGAFIRRDH